MSKTLYADFEYKWSKEWYAKAYSYYENELHQIQNPIVTQNLHYMLISGNPNITSEIVQSNKNKPWNYKYLREFVTWEIIKSNPNKDWDYSYAFKQIRVKDGLTMH